MGARSVRARSEECVSSETELEHHLSDFNPSQREQVYQPDPLDGMQGFRELRAPDSNMSIYDHDLWFYAPAGARALELWSLVGARRSRSDRPMSPEKPYPML